MEKIQKIFSEKYIINSDIDSIIRCLYSFYDITNYFKNLNKNEIKNKPITKAFIRCLKTFTKKDMILYIDSIKALKKILCDKNENLIKPNLLLPFLIRKLFNEMEDNLVLDKKDNSNQINEEEMIINLGNNSLGQLNSYISKKIMGVIKTAYKCEKCSVENFSFKGYFNLTIDLENIVNPDIEQFIPNKNNIITKIEKYCSNCLTLTKQEKRKIYDIFPDCLIVSIKRGENNSCKKPFKLKQNIEIKNSIGNIGKKYELISFINRNCEFENYISFIKFQFPNSKKWFKCEKENIERWKPKEHTDMFDDPKGELIMAFYKAKQ